MRKFAAVAALAVATIATPAAAQGEVRAEARGGIVWAEGDSEATLGAALGYDFDLGETAFAGVEVSGDKILAEGADMVFGTTARLGVKTGDAGKLYGALGYTFENDAFYDSVVLGAGYEHKLSDSIYVGGNYRHFFSDFIDYDAAYLSVGATF